MRNTEHLCQLCGVKSKSGIEIFGYKGVQLSIQSILVQHFAIEIIESDDKSKIVCNKCWKITDAFHQLYCLVKDVVAVFKCEKKSPIQLSQVPQTVVSNEHCGAQLDFIEVKVESYDYNLYQDDVCTNPKPNVPSKVEIKEEDIEDDRISPPLAETPSELTKQLTARQLQATEQDKEINKSLAIVCELCDTKCSTFSDLRHHFQAKHKVAGYIRCCGRKYKFRSQLYNHLRDHESPVPLECSKCQKTFTNSAKLKIHMKRHDPTFKKIQCMKCPKLFPTKWHLKKHMETHSENRPKTFTCDICGKSYNSKLGVQSHLLAVHVKKNSRICDICGKLFVNEKLLDGHYTIQHLGIRLPKVQCNICGKWLTHKSVREHLQHHYVKEETCEICGKKAPHRNALRSHMKRVHSGQIFPCTMCEKKFKRQKCLTEHISTHTGFNLYKCKYCPREFNYESSLYKHRKDMHSIEVEEDVRQNVFTPFTRIKKINVENDPRLSPQYHL